MATYVALLRSVTTVGTRKLRMDVLKRLCERAGFTDVRTVIATGNAVFRSSASPATIKRRLEAALIKPMHRRVLVVVRTADELAAAIAANPYPDCEPSRLVITFLDAAPRAAERESLGTWRIPGGERITLIGRELFVAYPSGTGPSKLRSPFADVGTGRNLNTARAILAVARDQESQRPERPRRRPQSGARLKR